MAGHREPDRVGADRARVVSTPTQRPPSTMKPVTSQFWMMSTPSCVGGARIAPGDRVVARDAGRCRCQLPPKIG